MPRPGDVGRFEAVVEDRHTADAMGNPGVRVLSTPNLAHFCALAAQRAVSAGLGEGEIAVPLRTVLAHLKASPPGDRVEATALVETVEGGRVALAVEARGGGGTLMTGTQTWTVEDRAAFLARAGG